MRSIYTNHLIPFFKSIYSSPMPSHNKVLKRYFYYKLYSFFISELGSRIMRNFKLHNEKILLS